MNLLTPARQERVLLQGMTCERVESDNDPYFAYILERLSQERTPAPSSLPGWSEEGAGVHEADCYICTGWNGQES